MLTLRCFFFLALIFLATSQCTTDVECNDDNPCTVDTCTGNVCGHTAASNGTSCDDDLWCNGRDICLSGQCQHLGDPCSRGVVCSNLCDEDKNSCVAPSGTSCDDGLFCNGADVCDGQGHCISSGDPCPGCICSNTNQTCSAQEGSSTCAVLNNADDLAVARSSGAALSMNYVIAGSVVGGIVLLVLVGLLVGLLIAKKRRNAGIDIMKEKLDMEAHEGASGVVHLPNTGGLPGMSRMILTPVLENSPRNSPLNVRKAVAYSAESAERIRMENQATSIDEVEIGRALGSGNFGEVFYGMWRKPQGGDIEIALKKLHRPDKFENFRDEASTLRQLQHSNIVRYYGVFVDHNRHDMYLATEYMKSGSLIDVLQILSKKISEDQMVEMALGAALGMSYLEKSNVVHRNLSCRNLLVSIDDSGHYVVKVSDFGNAKCVTGDTGDFVASDIIVPVRWSATEVLRKNIFSIKSDVWSFGVCMWEIFEKGREPWADCSDFQVSEWVLSGERLDQPADCADDLYDVMSSCWMDKTEERPNFQTIVEMIGQVMTDRSERKVEEVEESEEEVMSTATRLQTGRMEVDAEEDEGETL